ncbi:unnamed protein product [Polarella glacialis]|uniref:EF-hand domain-containing protein n=1 Tax=Polarella glacialis TaxID=89957 RepID=A0A813JNC4_POLGL|nr:unnamed protein product [Polarella glacialis]
MPSSPQEYEGTNPEDILTQPTSQMRHAALVVESFNKDILTQPTSEMGHTLSLESCNESAEEKSQSNAEEGPEDFEECPDPLTSRGKGSNDFIRVVRQFSDEELDKHAASADTLAATVAKSRRLVKRVLRSQAFSACMALVIVFDVWVSGYELDQAAAGLEVPAWVPIASGTCFAIYIVEFLAVLFIKQYKVFDDRWVIMDFVIICGGFVDIVATAAGSQVELLGIIRILRVLRIARLLKVFRKVRELRKLLMMSTSCIRTLCWSFVFCFMVMTFWSMAAVALLNPLIQDMGSQGMWHDCPECISSMSSVMRANLELFKTIISGDSWGLVAVPVITAYPWSAIIYIGALLTIVFGVLNMIVCVVVDEMAEKRMKDIQSLAEDMDVDLENDMKFLRKIFTQIDEDNSGEVDLEELVSGAKRVPEFRHRLRVMDIDETDLRQLFTMLDEDDSGAIEAEEFISAISRWMSDSKTASRFVKYNMMRSMQRQEEHFEYTRQRLETIDLQLRAVTEPQTATPNGTKEEGLPSARMKKKNPIARRASTTGSIAIDTRTGSLAVDASTSISVSPMVWSPDVPAPYVHNWARDFAVPCIRSERAMRTVNTSMLTHPPGPHDPISPQPETGEAWTAEKLEAESVISAALNQVEEALELSLQGAWSLLRKSIMASALEAAEQSWNESLRATAEDMIFETTLGSYPVQNGMGKSSSNENGTSGHSNMNGAHARCVENGATLTSERPPPFKLTDSKGGKTGKSKQPKVPASLRPRRLFSGELSQLV